MAVTPFINVVHWGAFGFPESERVWCTFQAKYRRDEHVYRERAPSPCYPDHYEVVVRNYLYADVPLQTGFEGCGWLILAVPQEQVGAQRGGTLPPAVHRDIVERGGRIPHYCLVYEFVTLRQALDLIEASSLLLHGR